MIEKRYRESVDPVPTDRRDIDLSLAQLTGEGAQQVAGGREKHLQDIAQPWEKLPTPHPDDPTYYDRPLLKEPVWEWAVPLYYFVGGAAGASLAMGAAAQFDRSGKLYRMVRRCHWTGVIGTALSAGLLVVDLGRPSRFLNMLRVFRPTSPMNMGVWILCGASQAAVTAAVFYRRRGVWGKIGQCAGAASGLFGLGLATYTGVLVANSAIPVWQASRRILPVLFGASAMASAGSIFDLASEDREAARITYTFGAIGRVAELAAAVVMEKQAASAAPAVAGSLRSGVSGMLWKSAAVLTAASLVASMLPRQSRKKRTAAGVLGVMGSLLMRYAVHQAGVASARAPRASFHLQRSGMTRELTAG